MHKHKQRILVWDLPVRVFHWLLAASFAGAFLTAESERWRDIHVMLGYSVLGLLLFRLVWAVMGSRYARLRSFAFGPKAVLAYLSSLLTTTPARHVGHNPAGSWAIYAIVALGLATAASGYGVYNDLGGRWIEALHEGAANIMLALVVVHVAGVVVESFLHGENLVASMLTGYKAGRAGEGIGRTRWVTAVVLAGCVAAYWSGIVDVAGPAPSGAGTASHEPARHPSPQRAAGHDG